MKRKMIAIRPAIRGPWSSLLQAPWLTAMAAGLLLAAVPRQSAAEAAPEAATPPPVASPFGEDGARAEEAPAAAPSAVAPRAALEAEAAEEVGPEGEAPTEAEVASEAEVAPEPRPRPAIGAPQPPLALPARAAEADLWVASPAPSEPRPWHVRLAGGTSEVFARSASLDPLKADDHLVFGGVAVEAEWEVVAGVPLALHAGYLGTELGDPLFGALTTSVEVNAMVLGLGAGYRLWDALALFVRGGFVGTWAEVDVDGTLSDVGGRDFAAGGFGLAGVELLVPRAWMLRAFRTDVFTLGARFEAGYVYLGRLTFGGGEGEGLLEHEEAALGALTLGGAAMDVAFLISF